MSKDEPKRKIYRILDPKSPSRELLAKHEKRKADLVAKCGAPIPAKAVFKAWLQSAKRLYADLSADAVRHAVE